MKLIRKHAMHTVKLNPSQIFTLFTLPLAYDLPLMSEYFMRNTTQLAYEVAFDDYIRFILLETVAKPISNYASKYNQSHLNATFLATDGKLHENAKIVNLLLSGLGDGKPETLRERNFSTISTEVKDALYFMFENFLLNMAVLQVKMVEFQRWDNNHGDYVPYIIPTLGVFECLINMKDIQIEFEEDVEGDRFVPKTLNYLSEFDVPSNITVATLPFATCNAIYEGMEYSNFEISYYLYKGIFSHAVPTGTVATLEDLKVIDAKVSALEAYNAEYESASMKLRDLVLKHNADHLPREEFIASIMHKVATLTAEGKKVKHAYSEICKLYPIVKAHEMGINKPAELTDKELSVKLKVDVLRAKPRWEDRYPHYTYDQLLNRIYSKELREEELCELEKHILEVETYVDLLCRLIELVQYFYYEKEELYLWLPKTADSDALNGEDTLLEEGYLLREMLAD